MRITQLLSAGVMLTTLPLAGCGGSDTAVSFSFSLLTPTFWSPLSDNRFIVARNALAWEAAWRDHAGDRSPPAVNFRDSMVVGIFLGTRNGYCVQPVVKSITEFSAPARIEVAYREAGPAACPPAGFPPALVVVPYSPLPVEFSLQR
ncbi:MAG TPA: hypothetical protein VGU61_10325 [Noviherbaspirillum sp.]|jgi:hypothetical protein|uniref:hypothetical protein n=1 Tax=Noviherbaspirillum sp. TaxID=1926288 RepID=UPI002DDD2BA7|nr:hypothetical protein [Noviherbaspirillum sp.]HEV2610649.1 hypothetical protein [Noviherbaspirillum sp.]